MDTIKMHGHTVFLSPASSSQRRKHDGAWYHPSRLTRASVVVVFLRFKNNASDDRAALSLTCSTVHFFRIRSDFSPFWYPHGGGEERKKIYSYCDSLWSEYCVSIKGLLVPIVDKGSEIFVPSISRLHRKDGNFFFFFSSWWRSTKQGINMIERHHPHFFSVYSCIVCPPPLPLRYDRHSRHFSKRRQFAFLKKKL